MQLRLCLAIIAMHYSFSTAAFGGFRILFEGGNVSYTSQSPQPISIDSEGTGQRFSISYSWWTEHPILLNLGASYVAYEYDIFIEEPDGGSGQASGSVGYLGPSIEAAYPIPISQSIIILPLAGISLNTLVSDSAGSFSGISADIEPSSFNAFSILGASVHFILSENFSLIIGANYIRPVLDIATAEGYSLEADLITTYVGLGF